MLCADGGPGVDEGTAMDERGRSGVALCVAKPAKQPTPVQPTAFLAHATLTLPSTPTQTHLPQLVFDLDWLVLLTQHFKVLHMLELRSYTPPVVAEPRALLVRA